MKPIDPPGEVIQVEKFCLIANHIFFDWVVKNLNQPAGK